MTYTSGNRFGKSERLCSRTIISELFENGRTEYFPLFKVVWDKKTLPSSAPVQVAISVTKKGFRKAVDRNLVKRRIREAYRLNKTILHERLRQEGVSIAVMIIFRGESIPEYNEVEQGLKEVIERLIVKSRQKH